MEIFHQGLPGSGKSYATMVDHIIPRLKEGRKVKAHMDGLDYARIAEVAEIPLEQVNKLLIHLDSSQVLRIWEHAENDDLIVIDEAQNYWPSQRQKLGPEITKFVAEHRHMGIDLILMGQVINDVHALWRGRVDRRIDFLKLDSLGLDKRYQWILYKHLPGRDSWAKVSDGFGKYDPKYFGTYASHVDDVENKGVYKDNRFIIWKRPLYLVGGPLLLCIVIAAVIFLRREMTTAMGTKKDLEKSLPVVIYGKGDNVPTAPSTDAVNRPVKSSTADLNVESDEPEDLIASYHDKYRFRLLGVYRVGQDAQNGVIEVRSGEGSGAVVDVLKFRQIEALGYTLLVSSSGDLVYITKGKKRFTVTAWPVVRAGSGDDQSGSFVRVPVGSGLSS